MSSQKPKLLLLGPVPYLPETLQSEISPIADIVPVDAKSLDEFKKDLEGKYKGVVAFYHQHDSSTPFGKLGKEFFEILPKGVKILAHFGAGYDDVDVAAAKKAGITVTHTPSAVDDGTATTAVFLILAAVRQFSRAEAECRKGSWKKNLPLARDPESKTLGIIGLGGIGKVTARRLALGWGMKVLYHNRNEVDTKDLDFDVTYKKDLTDLLRESDVVSIHLPFNEKTKNILGEKEFAAMKKGSVFVNTARGGVVDEEALINALSSGHLAGAGLDVFPEEPKINPRLTEFSNVTLLPHMGTETWDSREKMMRMVLDNLIAGIKGEEIPNIVPEHK